MRPLITVNAVANFKMSICTVTPKMLLNEQRTH